MIIGLAGVARSGKDSFFKFCKDTYFFKKPNLRFAFADELKKELNNFLIKNFYISAFTESHREKEIIRPMLVGYGMSKRNISNGKYWIDKVGKEINTKLNDFNCFITDVRFENEVDQIKKWGGFCIYVSRESILAANGEEAENDPIIKSKCTHHFFWPNFNKEELLSDGIKNMPISFIKKIEHERRNYN